MNLVRGSEFGLWVIFNHEQTYVKPILHSNSIFFLKQLSFWCFICSWPRSRSTVIKLSLFMANHRIRIFLFCCIFRVIESRSRGFRFVGNIHPLPICKFSTSVYLFIICYAVSTWSWNFTFFLDFCLLRYKFFLFGERKFLKSFQISLIFTIIGARSWNFLIRQLIPLLFTKNRTRIFMNGIDCIIGWSWPLLSFKSSHWPTKRILFAWKFHINIVTLIIFKLLARTWWLCCIKYLCSSFHWGCKLNLCYF